MIRAGNLFTFLVVGFLIFQSEKSCFGQQVENQLWADYNLTVLINDKWTYGGDAGIRGLISNYDWNQLMIRPNIKYRFNYTFSTSPAIAIFSTFNKDAGNVHEFRIHQDFNAKWPDLGIVEFFCRVRLEQRFFFYENKNIPNDFDLRLRGLVGMETADIKLFGSSKPIYFQFIVEGFSTNEQTAIEVFINQTRLHLAMGHRLSENLRYEIHYIRQASRLLVEDGLEASNNIFRLRFYHRLQDRSSR